MQEIRSGISKELLDRLTVAETPDVMQVFARRQREIAAKHKVPLDVRITRRIGRNDPCPCGSGVKFKKCCGRNLAASDGRINT